MYARACLCTHTFTLCTQKQNNIKFNWNTKLKWFVDIKFITDYTNYFQCVCDFAGKEVSPRFLGGAWLTFSALVSFTYTNCWEKSQALFTASAPHLQSQPSCCAVLHTQLKLLLQVPSRTHWNTTGQPQDHIQPCSAVKPDEWRATASWLICSKLCYSKITICHDKALNFVTSGKKAIL